MSHTALVGGGDRLLTRTTLRGRAGLCGPSGSGIVDAMTQVHRVLPPEPVRTLDEHIKEVGTHPVPARLHADVQFQITVDVAAS